MKKISGYQFLMLVFLLLFTQPVFSQAADQLLNFKGSSLTLQQFIKQIQSQQALEFTFDEKLNGLMIKT